MKWNGTDWKSVGSTGFSDGQARYTSLAIYDSTPYVVYVDGANSNKATVMKFIPPPEPEGDSIYQWYKYVPAQVLNL
jgi:hypothetical protein